MKDEVQAWKQTLQGARVFCGHSRTQKTIKEYIQSQFREDELGDQMSLKEFVDPFTVLRLLSVKCPYRAIHPRLKVYFDS